MAFNKTLSSSIHTKAAIKNGTIPNKILQNPNKAKNGFHQQKKTEIQPQPKQEKQNNNKQYVYNCVRAYTNNAQPQHPNP